MRSGWWIVICALFSCGPSAQLEEARATAVAARSQLQRAVENDQAFRRQTVESLKAATQAREEAQTRLDGLKATHSSLWERFARVELFAEPAAEAAGVATIGKCRSSPSEPRRLYSSTPRGRYLWRDMSLPEALRIPTVSVHGGLLYSVPMVIPKSVIRAGLDLLGQAAAPMAGRAVVAKWNALMRAGELERARSQIKLEFLRNRDLARLIYEKHRGDMSDEVAAIFEEMVQQEA